jgi:type I restriction enzyme S subunit
MAGEWRVFRLGDVCSKIGSGATPRGGSSVYLDEGEIALIRSQNVYNDGFHRDGLAYLIEQHADELSNVELAENDILLNITGDSVARSCQVPSTVLPARVNQHVAIIRTDPTVLLPGFLHYYLVSPAMQAEMLSLAGAGATRKALTKGMIERFEVLAPVKVAEQRAIAHILGTFDDKIELNRRMNATLEAMARALFKSWFVDFDPVRAKIEGRDTGLPAEVAALFPDAFEASAMGEAPRGWRVVSLPEAIEVNPTRSLAGIKIAPYLDMASMPTRGHRTDQWIERPVGSGMKFVNGDTLLARITPCLENGKTAYVDFLKDGQVGWGSTEYIVLRPKHPLPPSFGYYLARTEELRTFAIQNMTGSSGRQRVPAECLTQFLLVVPSERVAQRFGKTAQEFMDRIRINSEQSRTLAALRDALLPKLISGAVRVGEAERFMGAAG